VLRRAAGERERRPAEAAERLREPDDVLPQREIPDPHRRRHEGHRGREQEVGLAERLQRAFPVILARGERRLDLVVRDGEAALHLRAHVHAVEVAVLGEELPVDVRHLPLERG
jgi:hypothetical protein